MLWQALIGINFCQKCAKNKLRRQTHLKKVTNIHLHSSENKLKLKTKYYSLFSIGGCTKLHSYPAVKILRKIEFETLILPKCQTINNSR